MMKTSVTVLTLLGTARASSDFHSNSHSNKHNPHISYVYSEIHSMEYDAENDNPDEATVESTEIVSSLAADNGCFISAQAIMCNGGESSSLDRMQKPLVYMDASMLENDEEDYSEEEEDDDEDGEDDGHSSMLSNSSLNRRQRTLVGASSSGPSTRSEASSVPSTTGTETYFEGEVNLQNKHNGMRSSAALRLRGGNLSSMANSQLSKKLIVAAIVTLVFEGCIGHVLEFFKIVMQTSPSGTTYGKVYKDITTEKGLGGLWDGFVPWGVVQAILKGGVFGLAHATASKYLVPLAKDGVIPMQLALTLAGGIGGGFQGYVLSPTLLMKTRVMTNPVFREKMSLLKTTWLSFAIGADVVKKEGMMALMKGANVFATKRVFDWSTRYFFSDIFEALFANLKGSPLTGLEKSLASFMGGVASTCVTLPLDVLVAKTQDAKKAGVTVSAVKMFADELNELGLNGLQKKYMQGFEARLLHVCLTTVVLKTGAPIVYDKLFGSSSTSS